MRNLYLIGCVLMIISLACYAASCKKARTMQGPSEFGVYIDKQWDSPLQTTLKENWHIGQDPQMRGWNSVSVDTPVNTISSNSILYVYPSEWITRSDGLVAPSQVYVYPVLGRVDVWYDFCPASGIGCGAPQRDGCGTVQLISDARIGGTEAEPKMAARFKVQIQSTKEAYEGLYVLEFYKVDMDRYALVKLK